MSNKITAFKSWLFKQRYFRIAWFAKDEQVKPEPEEALANLPKTVADDIILATDRLLVPPIYIKTIADRLDDTIAAWQEGPTATPNSVVFLGHPISSVSRILIGGLEQHRDRVEKPLPINLLDWVERPPESRDIATQIKQKLRQPEHKRNPEDYKDGASNDKDEMTALNLAVIPNLSWCFLRSVEGLEGIDYLQDTLLRDRSQFWIISSGQVGWDYLNSTLKLNAYCGPVVELPALSAEQLREWLTPIIKEFDVTFAHSAIHKRINRPKDLIKETAISLENPAEAVSNISQEVSATVKSSIRALKDEVLSDQPEDEETSAIENYFERLADISDGVAIVALQIFIKSLRYKIVESTEEGEPEAFSDIPPRQDEANDNEAGNDKANNEDQTLRPKVKEDRTLIAVTPKLPPLPELSQSDMYLLYSLMLHGDLTVLSVAESLGDEPQTVNNQVQFLRKAGIIEQRGEVIKANPVHYPKLRRELAKNNFIINVPGE